MEMDLLACESSLLPKDIGRPAEISSEPPTSSGSRSRLCPSCRRCREVGADCVQAADDAGRSEQIVSGFFDRLLFG